MFFNDGHQHIDRIGNPDLGLDGIFVVTIELLDPQVLFDPFEEELHLPASLVELSNAP